MLYLIGLGLNIDGISAYGLEVVKRCKRIYLENYTVNFPYSTKELEQFIGKKLELADRELVEGLSIIDEAAKKDVALLVYGSPLTATTHIALIDEAKASGIRYKIIYNASILDAVAETGLQIYKFGKIASMPKWQADKNYEPDSFMEIVSENQKINAHSLILMDIGLEFDDAIQQLKESAEKHKVELKKIIVCQALGTQKRKIAYGSVKDVSQESIKSPYCFIIPCEKLHHLEKQVLEGLS